jgi:DNA polymerase-3 subunit delta'
MDKHQSTFSKEVKRSFQKNESVTVYLLMVWNYTLGQERIKKHLSYLLESGQVPHAQLFISDSGRGNLPMALEFSLALLNSKTLSDESKSLGEKCQHPNLHFIYPVVKKGAEKVVYSRDYATEWYSFISQNPYGNFNDWFDAINVGNKQGIIGVPEIENLHQRIYLKAFGGGNKVCVLWGLEKMNAASANAFLKLLEEPPKQTYFILLCENTETILPTVLSRCQKISLGPIDEASLSKMIPEEFENKTQLLKQADGNYRNLLLTLNDNQNKEYETLLVQGLRYALKAKKNKSVAVELMNWSNELSVLGREKQKAFLLFSIQFLRDAFLKNYKLDDLVHHKSEINFDLNKLAPFVHSGNIVKLNALLEKHHYYIQRNANSKMLFAELALDLTRLINAPSP